MPNFTEQEFVQFTNDLYKNVKRRKLDKSVHWDGSYNLSNGYQLHGDEARAQMIGRINQPMKVGLGNIISKLIGQDPVDDPVTGDAVYPDFIVNDLIRYGELKREKDIYVYHDRTNNEVYGVVSPEHTYIPTKVVYGQLKTYYDNMGIDYNMRFQHNISYARIDIDFPEMSIEVGKEDSLGYLVTVMNGDWGHHSLSYDGGFVRYRCTNGMILKDTDVSYRQVHKMNDKLLLTKFLGAMVESFSGYDIYADRLVEAAEITEQYIDDRVGLIKFLPDNFDIKVREARDIYTMIRQRHYKNNAFWTGQGIAEIAQEKPLNDRYRLEQIAGQVMLAQVTV